MQRSAFCRSRRELSNAYFLAKIGLDTAENEPSLVCPIPSDRDALYQLLSRLSLGSQGTPPTARRRARAGPSAPARRAGRRGRGRRARGPGLRRILGALNDLTGTEALFSPYLLKILSHLAPVTPSIFSNVCKEENIPNVH